ncbi:RHS repeat-associated core domain-containing protein [Paenibacillus lentus]|uniref:RHS repeat-associated core domain-containing protein n=1 Tax=Paenibacillus lentus TaxID=1338368 RepID=UPI003CCC7014
MVTDHLGTPVEMYDEHGERVWSCELDIYGNVRKFILKGDHNACPFRYPGQYEDVETGLYYNRFRYYSPNEGMYTQQDPIGLNGGIRLYGYVDDPIIWVDVFGLKKNGGSNGGNSTHCGTTGNDSDTNSKLSKNAELLRTGGNDTTVFVKSKADADALLKKAFPDYQKVRGVGPQDASGIRKKTKMDRFKQGGAYHKDYAIDPKTGRVRGHADNNDHGTFPHINIKRKDGKKVLINIIRK